MGSESLRVTIRCDPKGFAEITGIVGESVVSLTQFSPNRISGCGRARAVSSSTQRGVAAAAVENVDSSWLNRLDVYAPSYVQQFDGALLDIRPGGAFPATLRREACP